MSEYDDYEERKREFERHHDKKNDEEYRQKRLDEEIETEKWAIESQFGTELEGDQLVDRMRRLNRAEDLLLDMRLKKHELEGYILATRINILIAFAWHEDLSKIDLSLSSSDAKLNDLLNDVNRYDISSDVFYKLEPEQVETAINRIESDLRSLINARHRYEELID